MTSRILFFLGFVAAAFVASEKYLASEPEIMPKTQASYGCISRNQVDVQDALFWGWEESERPDFIYFDREKWEFVVCLNNKALTVALEKPPPSELEYTEVSITERYLQNANASARPSVPYLDDLNGDGKLEFIVQIGHCVEGPCVGSSYIFQIDGNQIRTIGEIDSWVVRPIYENGRRAVVALKQCFDYDFGIEFNYFSIVEFARNGLVTVPYNEIHNTYPETFLSHLEKESTPLGKLVMEAYRGTNIQELEDAYAALIKQNPDLSNLHCDPLEIIRSITGSSGSVGVGVHRTADRLQ